MFQVCFSKPGFASEYKLGRDLGKGAFSTVYLAHHIKTKSPVAVKVVLRKKLTRDDERALQAEVQVLEEVRGNEGIITLIKYFGEPQKHYLVLEVMTGGELFQRIVTREQYSEVDALEVVRTIANVLEFIHGRDIAIATSSPKTFY
ncbi:myosin light chain kinase A [Batrachochytrium salamandrivorans]|nr:myosin light chain kinase A [Batrachochytrium salamandrivorans]